LSAALELHSPKFFVSSSSTWFFFSHEGLHSSSFIPLPPPTFLISLWKHGERCLSMCRILFSYLFILFNCEELCLLFNPIGNVLDSFLFVN
jgi:hypothetical protein